jgi:hypothetical protein
MMIDEPLASERVQAEDEGMFYVYEQSDMAYGHEEKHSIAYGYFINSDCCLNGPDEPDFCFTSSFSSFVPDYPEVLLVAL